LESNLGNSGPVLWFQQSAVPNKTHVINKQIMVQPTWPSPNQYFVSLNTAEIFKNGQSWHIIVLQASSRIFVWNQEV
jgi:hypothetical protein